MMFIFAAVSPVLVVTAAMPLPISVTTFVKEWPEKASGKKSRVGRSVLRALPFRSSLHA